MSYILEALKKSDQQRQRGATPTLQVAQIAVAAPKRPMFVYYSLFAVVLLVTGIMIGWLQPWQTMQAPVETEPLDSESPFSMTVQSVHPSGEMQPGNPALASPAPSVMAASTPEISSSPGGVAQEQEAISLEALPLAIRQEIPDMAVQFHSYSSKPGERLVSVNSIRLREGGLLMLGLRLEQITPDGMIFSYKGYRFRRGIR